MQSCNNAVNRGKRELHDAARARLLSVWGKAAENLASAIDEGDLKASVLLLKGLGGLSGAVQHLASLMPDARRLKQRAKRSVKPPRIGYVCQCMNSPPKLKMTSIENRKLRCIASP